MLSDVFNYISTQVYQQGWKFSEISSWLTNQGWPWKYLAPPFQFLRDISFDIGWYFYNAYRLTKTIEDWLSDTWDKAKQAFDYAYDVLRIRVNEALNDARDAFDYAYDVLRVRVNEALNDARDAFDYAHDAFHLADDAWDYATGWLRDKAIDAYNMAVAVFDDIAAAVTAAAQDIYAWVKTIPLEIRNFIDGIVATLQTWAGGAIDDVRTSLLATFAGPFNLINLWFDDIQGFFNSPLDWLGDKFNDWFFGPEK